MSVPSSKHLGWSEAAVAGYSFGAFIIERLLKDPWVSRAALRGVGSFKVEGEAPWFSEWNRSASECFLEDRWSEHPELPDFHATASVSGSDFTAMGLIFAVIETAPRTLFEGIMIPVLVLNGGNDLGVRTSSTYPG